MIFKGILIIRVCIIEKRIRIKQCCPLKSNEQEPNAAIPHQSNIESRNFRSINMEFLNFPKRDWEMDYTTFEHLKQQFYIALSFSDCNTIAYIDKTVRKVKELTYCHHSSIANYWKDRGKLKGFNSFFNFKNKKSKFYILYSLALCSLKDQWNLVALFTGRGTKLANYNLW